MILETYQEQQAIVQPDPPGQSFATVGTVYEDGIALIFNGAEAESLKHYKCNAAVRFTAGQRVRIIEDLCGGVSGGRACAEHLRGQRRTGRLCIRGGICGIRRKSSDGHKGRHRRQRGFGGYGEKRRDC